MDDFKSKLNSNGMLLKLIPAKERTEELCLIAVKQNPKALQYVPSKKQSEEICKAALKQDASAFKFIKERNQTPEVCEYAVSQKPDLLKDLKHSVLTEELCKRALSVSMEILPYVPHHFRETIFANPDAETVQKLLDYIRADVKRSAYLPESVRGDHGILEYQKKCGCLMYGKKFYEDKQFVVRLACFPNVEKKEQPGRCDYYLVDAYFADFDSYYTFLDGDLKKANFLGYDFDGIDLHNYDITGAVIDSKVLSAQGLYDGTYWQHLRPEIRESETTQNELALPDDFYYPRPVEDDQVERYDFNHFTFFYISDIHLEWKIGKHFGDFATREEIYQFVSDFADELVSSAGSIPYYSILLIAGDTADHFDLNEVFYSRLAYLWNDRGRSIFVISGNHELWDPAVDMEGNIAAYRELFGSLHIRYLQNELFGMGKETVRLSGDQILHMTAGEIQNKIRSCPLLILGGIGFSGLNERYNAVNLDYGPTFHGSDAREKDKEEAARFNQIYKKLMKAAYHNRVIVLTHMPKPDWNQEPYNPNWFYVNGHNHRNYLAVDEKKRVYADNQIGYRKQHLGLKYFRTDNDYDIFSAYPEGIYKITLDEYKEFHTGKRISVNFSKDGEIYVLKRKSNYMFFFFGRYNKTAKKEKLYFLNGGQMSGAKEDLQYYYDNLGVYVDNIHALLERYTGAQKKLSEFIKNLGGSGNIHGCIIDVDSGGMFSFVHLYLNPLDGKVTPYFAYDTRSRMVYKDLRALLEDNVGCAVLLDNYKKLESQTNWNPPAVVYGSDLPLFDEHGAAYDEGNYIYKMSRIIKKLQYCLDKNIVRYWDEKLLNHEFVKDTIEAGTMDELVNEKLLESLEEIKSDEVR